MADQKKTSKSKTVKKQTVQKTRLNSKHVRN